MTGYRAEIRVLQEEHLPPSINQLITGTFSQGLILCPQDGQVDAGEDKVIGESLVRSPSGTSRNSSHWQRHSCCIIFGRRRITTFRKLPMQRETMVTVG